MKKNDGIRILLFMSGRFFYQLWYVLTLAVVIASAWLVSGHHSSIVALSDAVQLFEEFVTCGGRER